MTRVQIRGRAAQGKLNSRSIQGVFKEEMTIFKEYLGNFLTANDNKLQTLHFTKCLFEVPSIARFQ